MWLTYRCCCCYTQQAVALAQFDEDGDGILSLREAAAGAMMDPVSLMQAAAMESDQVIVPQPNSPDSSTSTRSSGQTTAGSAHGDAGCEDGGGIDVGDDGGAARTAGWSTRHVVIAAGIYTVAAVPIALAVIRCAVERAREGWMREGRLRTEREILQSMAT